MFNKSPLIPPVASRFLVRVTTVRVSIRGFHRHESVDRGPRVVAINGDHRFSCYETLINYSDYATLGAP